MKCEYGRIVRFAKKRGDWCLINVGSTAVFDTPAYGTGGGLCGCGTRIAPGVKYRRRIARRTLKRKLDKECQE